MPEHTRKHATEAFADLRLRIPSGQYDKVVEAIRSVLAVAEIPFRQVNDQGEELFTPEEVFGPRDAGRILKGARAREGVTQRQLAERMGVRQHHISEMENGRRPITPDMARRLAEALGVASYKVFL